ncbi:DUF4181 domain-containing protein [Alkalibacillus almallahensis]|uniref:DUF4181 domain-containing protein n=1 Tax=Alkalibacillus almallahensis TaxID=1379154 RepID=UPI001421CE7A|nr:DUF4181 domain-containing protein [Alkalibacillus almallahensis]
MIPIFFILICILILDQLINKNLIKRNSIEQTASRSKYVNKIHKYGELILYGATMIVMVLSVIEFYYLRLLIFIGPGITFAFRTIMKWKFTNQDKTYLLSAVTCGLFMIGSIVYGVFEYNLIV